MKPQWHNIVTDYLGSRVDVVLFVGSYQMCLDEVNGFFKKTFFPDYDIDVRKSIDSFRMGHRYAWCANASCDDMCFQIIKMERLDVKNPFDLSCLAHECCHAAINVVRKYTPNYVIDVSDERVPRLVQDIYSNLLSKLM